MKISRNNGHNWATYGNNEQIHLNDGETVCFKGNNPNGFNNNDTYCKFVMSGTGTLTVQGSITSLLDNGKGDLAIIPNEHCFKNLFDGCTKLVSAENLKLPNNVTSNCYSYMFSGCTSLTSAPELPATTLAESCYSKMFYGCTSLTSAPELPATTLAT